MEAFSTACTVVAGDALRGAHRRQEQTSSRWSTAASGESSGCRRRSCEAYKRDRRIQPRPRGAMPYAERILSYKAADRISILTLRRPPGHAARTGRSCLPRRHLLLAPDHRRADPARGGRRGRAWRGSRHRQPRHRQRGLLGPRSKARGIATSALGSGSMKKRNHPPGACWPSAGTRSLVSPATPSTAPARASCARPKAPGAGWPWRTCRASASGYRLARPSAARCTPGASRHGKPAARTRRRWRVCRLC